MKQTLNSLINSLSDDDANFKTTLRSELRSDDKTLKYHFGTMSKHPCI